MAIVASELAMILHRATSALMRWRLGSVSGRTQTAATGFDGPPPSPRKALWRPHPSATLGAFGKKAGSERHCAGVSRSSHEASEAAGLSARKRQDRQTARRSPVSPALSCVPPNQERIDRGRRV